MTKGVHKDSLRKGEPNKWTVEDIIERLKYLIASNKGFNREHRDEALRLVDSLPIKECEGKPSEAVEGELFKKAEYWVARNYPFAKGEEFDRLVTIYISGVAEGERRATEQMMKEAVEARVGRNFTGVQQIFFTVYPDKYKDGDKVKLIIVKED